MSKDLHEEAHDIIAKELKVLMYEMVADHPKLIVLENKVKDLFELVISEEFDKMIGGKK